MMVVLTAAGGMWLSGRVLSPRVIVLMLVATAALVASANTLNCFIERDIDRHMTRTAGRPLPSGRLDPRVALGLGLLLGAISVPVLTFAVNALTGLLGAIALVTYVGIYTPLKQRSWVALLVGAVPGALPPLMGWTAATDRLGAPGLVLFGILFLWQLPHFIAIATFRKDEYVRAGLKTMPAELGDRISRVHAALYAAALLAVSVLLFPLGVAGPFYLAAALVLGAVFLAASLMGLRPHAGRRWARGLFYTSLVYLPLLCAAILLDAG